MEVTGNIYDDSREGDTTQTNALADTQAKDSQTKISGASQWARRIFTTLAVVGWIALAILILDAMFNNSKLIIWTMIGN